jgi:hypothetical protein
MLDEPIRALLPGDASIEKKRTCGRSWLKDGRAARHRLTNKFDAWVRSGIDACLTMQPVAKPH